VGRKKDARGVRDFTSASSFLLAVACATSAARGSLVPDYFPPSSIPKDPHARGKHCLLYRLRKGWKESKKWRMLGARTSFCSACGEGDLFLFSLGEALNGGIADEFLTGSIYYMVYLCRAFSLPENRDTGMYYSR